MQPGLAVAWRRELMVWYGHTVLLGAVQCPFSYKDRHILSYKWGAVGWGGIAYVDV
jgi:hypothetical protein